MDSLVLHWRCRVDLDARQALATQRSVSPGRSPERHGDLINALVLSGRPTTGPGVLSIWGIWRAWRQLRSAPQALKGIQWYLTADPRFIIRNEFTSALDTVVAEAILQMLDE